MTKSVLSTFVKVSTFLCQFTLSQVIVLFLYALVNPFYSGYLQAGTLANSEDPDE